MILISSLFVLTATCYILYLLSNPLEETGGKLGKLLKLPESVIASTFQALATSGPEIVMAILAATTYVTASHSNLTLAEKGSSGALNMSFSAMDNLLGIGAVALVFMLITKRLKPSDIIPADRSTRTSLTFYIIISGFFTYSICDRVLTYKESIILAIIGATYLIAQFLLSDKKSQNTDDIPTTPIKWTGSFISNMFIYAFLVFALIIFVRLCVTSTFDLATLGIASVGGVLLAITSYVSSFPEFMMSFRYAVANKKDALLSMLFGSNVIDLAFAGYRSIHHRAPMDVYTTGSHSWLLSYYIGCLPVLGTLILIGLMAKKIKYKYAIPALAFYVIYIVSGFILL